MSPYQIHTVETAPEASKPLLEKVEKNYGFLPTILGAMAEAPAALEGYLSLTGILERCSFSARERQFLFLVVSRENGCKFCVAAHSGGAIRTGLDKDTVDAARNGTPVSDPKLSALRDFAIALTLNRGRISPAEFQAFLDAGYSKAQAFEVIAAISLKVLTNYVDALAEAPLNEQLQPLAWTPVPQEAAE